MKNMSYNGTFSYKKDIGKVRLTNEDEAKILVNSSNNVLMIVCDGMGGANKGDYASKAVINTLAFCRDINKLKAQVDAGKQIYTEKLKVFKSIINETLRERQ